MKASGFWLANCSTCCANFLRGMPMTTKLIAMVKTHNAPWNISADTTSPQRIVCGDMRDHRQRTTKRSARRFRHANPREPGPQSAVLICYKEWNVYCDRLYRTATNSGHATRDTASYYYYMYSRVPYRRQVTGSGFRSARKQNSAHAAQNHSMRQRSHRRRVQGWRVQRCYRSSPRACWPLAEMFRRTS